MQTPNKHRKTKPVVLTIGFLVYQTKTLYNMTYQIDENGFYGQFGGAFIPDSLCPAIKELTEKYLHIIESEEFKQEYHQLLHL